MVQYFSAIDVGMAEVSPDSSTILSTVAAGCSPTRMVETADNQTLWVSARGDNRGLALNTGLLETGPAVSLLGYANSGDNAPDSALHMSLPHATPPQVILKVIRSLLTQRQSK